MFTNGLYKHEVFYVIRGNTKDLDVEKDVYRKNYEKPSC